MPKIRNIRVAVKLVITFLLVALIGLAIGFVGISGMKKISHEDEQMYLYNTVSMSDLAIMYDTLATQRICLNNILIFSKNDPEFSDSEAESLIEKENLFDEAFAKYKSCISNEEEESLYNSIHALYYSDFAEIKKSIIAAIAAGDDNAMTKIIKEMDGLGSTISGYMDEAFTLNKELASNKVDSNKKLFTERTILLLVVMVIGLTISVLLSVFIAKIINRPLNRMLQVAKQIGNSGNLSFSDKTISTLKQDAEYKDEIGQVMFAFSIMLEAFIEKAKVIENIASGDFSMNVRLASEYDTIGNALIKMLNHLNDMFGEIKNATVQVATGSTQIANGAQSLAQGSTEQAVTVDRLSGSITEVASKAKGNADMANRASSLADTIKNNAEKGSTNMDRMIQAVKEISEANQSINKVIKMIDDIAYQTNILALNASVEASRAGQHGRGFSVVAEEVRKLAAKSSMAAKDTASLIENSMEKIGLGEQIAEETATSLLDIVSGINESNQVIGEIARSSSSQSDTIIEINKGIGQVSQVIQQNSATAEQSAAASEEMNNQSDMLQDLVTQFKLREI